MERRRVVKEQEVPGVQQRHVVHEQRAVVQAFPAPPEASHCPVRRCRREHERKPQRRQPDQVRKPEARLEANVAAELRNELVAEEAPQTPAGPAVDDEEPVQCPSVPVTANQIPSWRRHANSGAVRRTSRASGPTASVSSKSPNAASPTAFQRRISGDHVGRLAQDTSARRPPRVATARWRISGRGARPRPARCGPADVAL